MKRLASRILAALVPALLLGLALLSQRGLAQDFDTTTHTVANPQSAAREQANAALAARDYARAIQLLTPLAEANPKDAQVLYDLGSAEDALDQSGAAETSYRAAIAAEAKPLEPHLALGLLYARAAKVEAARAELLTAARTEDGDKLLKARAYRALARLDQTARPTDASDELLEALKLSPETPEDSLMAAELAERSAGGGPEAEAALRRLLARRPNDPEATAALAHLLVGEKRGAEAERLLNGSLSANPGDPVLTMQLATLLNAENKAAEALPMVEKLHVAHPDNASVTHLLAGLYTQIGDYAQALPLYGGLAARSPEDVSLLDAEGDALIHLKRFAEAEQVLSRAMAQPKLFATPPDLGNAAGRLAFAASENNDPAGALQALAVRDSVLPTTPPTLFLEAISEDKLHHVKLAQQAYRKFLQAANGTLPDQEFEAKHRLIALEHTK